MQTLSRDELVREINRIYHEEEAAIYDRSHPEIFERERNTWETLGVYLPKCPDGMRMLDIGGGTGFVPDALHKFLGERDTVTLLDVSPRMLEQAKKKLAGHKMHFEFVVAEGETLPFAGNSFDAITLNSVLHHIPNTAAFLCEVDRVLKPGGILMIAHEPNRAHLHHRLLRILVWGMQKWYGLKKRAVVLLRGSRASLSAASHDAYVTVYHAVNIELLRLGYVTEPLSSEKIQQYVDIHSPTAPRIPDASKGFIPQELIARYISGYRILYLETSAHLGKFSDSDSCILNTLDTLLGNMYPRSGSSFAIVYKKP